MLYSDTASHHLLCEHSGVLEQMAEHVRKGEFEAAVDCGNSFYVPLALPDAAVRGTAVLGKGTESVIRAGELDGAPVAMKKAVIRTPADLQRFRKEVGILCSLNHSNIISLLAARVLPPNYTMVLPRYTGSLEAFLHERGWRPRMTEVMSLAVCLAEAATAVHAAGLVHRDIKPGNVLLNDGGCVLSDFGLAETAQALKNTHAAGPTGGFHKQRAIGTLQYLPPEVLMSSFHTQASDVYALAVTLNEIATATRPFADCTKDNPACHTVLDANYSDLDLRAAVVAENLRPSLPQCYPASWTLLMQSCWQTKPEERPTCAAVVQALQDICAAEAIRLPAVVQLPVQSGVLEDASCKNPAHSSWVDLEDSPMSTASDNTVDVCVPEWQQSAVASALQRDVQPAMLCGSYADVGMRDSMEDRHVLAVSLHGLQQVSLLGVFDGHRGAAAAHTAVQALPTHLRERWSTSDSAGHALRAALEDCEERVLAHGQHAWDQHVAAAGAGAGTRRWPGCTALAAVQCGDVMSFANVGDCRAVMCRRGDAIQISRDHVVSDKQELQRLQGVGAKLQQGPDGIWRVGDAQLQVSRSLGDGDVKGAGGVSAEAELSTVLLDGDDEFVVLATDGLWDVVSNEDAVAIVHDTVKNPSMAAKRLTMEALARGSQDNVTVLVCFFKNFGTMENIYRDGKQKYSVARSFCGSRVELMAALAKGRATDELVEQL